MSHLPATLFAKRRFRLLLSFLIITTTICALIIVPLESTSPLAKITNYPDAAYWAVTTVTTVGYGDLVPVTLPGKLVTVILQLSGAASFMTIFVIIGITMNQATDHFRWHRTQDKLEDIEKKLENLHKHVTYKP